MDVLWFCYYGVIIWSGKNDGMWFLLFSIFCVIRVRKICAPTSTHVTKELNVLGNQALYFHAPCCVISAHNYAKLRRIVWRWKFHQISLYVCFCHFSWKVRRQPHYLFCYFEAFKTNICENQKNVGNLCCHLEHINIDLSNFYYFVW